MGSTQDPELYHGLHPRPRALPWAPPKTQSSTVDYTQSSTVGSTQDPELYRGLHPELYRGLHPGPRALPWATGDSAAPKQPSYNT
ncbi:hypothetical protein NHX12_012917 [Muraenolepis orangiensis]|uniref:Uncharacterized protein n=1 Tax=Muraenolepis orangiensis TaxID=630683 RepID=A0A9Q0DCX2_9TELE|nr:hypothetical protein NHX12_012917 [Muraenolepis orangiensis]